MKYLRAACLALASVTAAVAEERANFDSQQQSQHDKALQTPSCQVGEEEQSSHALSADAPATAVFVNGTLVVPGAPVKTDTVPAKFSVKKAADDELITVAFTFKTLTDEQRRAIYEALKDQPASAVNADVGAELPPGIELRPVPNEAAVRVPQTRDYRYAMAKDRVLLVGTSRIVVGVFADIPVSEECREVQAAPNATTDAGTTLLFGMQVTGAGAATATNDQVQAGDHLKRRALKANNLLPMRPSKKAASLSRCSAARQ